MKTAIRIDAKERQVSIVHTGNEWTNDAINEQINAVAGEVAKRPVEKYGDLIAVGDFINNTTAGSTVESHGFNLFGVTHYGDGLIFGAGGAEQPTVTTEEVLSAIKYVERAGSDPATET